MSNKASIQDSLYIGGFINSRAKGDIVNNKPAPEQVKQALVFINRYFRKTKGLNRNNSYNLKHLAEDWYKSVNNQTVYISNGAFIQAMAEAGFNCVQTMADNPNAKFNVGEVCIKTVKKDINKALEYPKYIF